MNQRTDLFFHLTIVVLIILCHDPVSVDSRIIRCNPCNNKCKDCEWGTIVRSACSKKRECAMGPSKSCGFKGKCAEHLVCVDNFCSGCIKNETGIDVCSYRARPWHTDQV